MAMSVSLKKFVQQPLEDTDEWRKVARLADRLCEHLNSPGAAARIEAANLPGQSSAVVQAAFGEFAGELGFES